MDLALPRSVEENSKLLGYMFNKTGEFETFWIGASGKDYKNHPLTRRLSGFEILNNVTLIFQKWLVSRHFANICHYLNFPEENL